MNKRLQERNKSFMQCDDFSKFNRMREKEASALRKSARLKAFNYSRKRLINQEDASISVSSLPESIKKIFSLDLSDNIKGAYIIRKIIGMEFNPPIQEIIDSGAIPVLIDFIKRFDCPELQYEAA